MGRDRVRIYASWGDVSWHGMMGTSCVPNITTDRANERNVPVPVSGKDKKLDILPLNCKTHAHAHNTDADDNYYLGWVLKNGNTIESSK